MSHKDDPSSSIIFLELLPRIGAYLSEGRPVFVWLGGMGGRRAALDYSGCCCSFRLWDRVERLCHGVCITASFVSLAAGMLGLLMSAKMSGRRVDNCVL
jgi:hypothetical protein